LGYEDLAADSIPDPALTDSFLVAATFCLEITGSFIFLTRMGVDEFDVLLNPGLSDVAVSFELEVEILKVEVEVDLPNIFPQ
jgi:hypothetical protein